MNTFLFILLLVFIIIVLITQKLPGSIFGAEEKVYYVKQIVEFCNDAKDGFKNCNERSLNAITIAEPGDYSFDKIIRELQLPENINRYKKTPEEIELLDLAKNVDGQGKIREIVGFYNIRKQYINEEKCGKLSKEDCGMDVGTYVTNDAFDIIFNDPVNLRNKLEGIRDKTSGQFHWSKGTGKANLKKVVEKLTSQGVKFLLLDAAGQEGLVKMYESYGFKVLSTGYKKNIFDDEWEMSSTSLMYGVLDEITKIIS